MPASETKCPLIANASILWDYPQPATIYGKAGIHRIKITEFEVNLVTYCASYVANTTQATKNTRDARYTSMRGIRMRLRALGFNDFGSKTEGSTWIPGAAFGLFHGFPSRTHVSSHNHCAPVP